MRNLVASLAVAALFGCASATQPPPVAVGLTVSTTCSPRGGIEVRLVSSTGVGEHVAAWSGPEGVLEPTVWLTSADVARVDVVPDPERPRRALSMQLRDDARVRLERLTGEHVGRHIAIVVGGRIAATLKVLDPVHGPALLVTGDSDADVERMRHAVCDL